MRGAVATASLVTFHSSRAVESDARVADAVLVVAGYIQRGIVGEQRPRGALRMQREELGDRRAPANGRAGVLDVAQEPSRIAGTHALDGAHVQAAQRGAHLVRVLRRE